MKYSSGVGFFLKRAKPKNAEHGGAVGPFITEEGSKKGVALKFRIVVNCRQLFFTDPRKY
jgi:hypothetical protein